MRRLVLLIVAALVLFAPAQPAYARARIDARVDALSARELLTRTASGLVDPGRQRRARAIADLRHASSAAWGLAQIAAFWWFWRSGTAARLRDVLRRRTRVKTWQRTVFGAALGALAPLAALPFALAAYRVGFNSGLTDERLDAWFADYAVRIVLDAALGALIVAGVLALVERVRVWYVIVTAVIVAGALGGVMFEPALGLGPAHKPTPRVVVAAAAEASRDLAMAPVPVVVTATSRHANVVSMRAAGIGPTTRVVMGDLDVMHFTPPELLVRLLHGEAHARAQDALRQTLFAIMLFVLSAAIAVLLSDRVGFRRDDDALSRLALVATFLGIVLTFTYPIYNAYARNLETRADDTALAAWPDRAATVRTWVRVADLNLVPLCDRRSIRWYFDDRPALGGRIARTAGTADPCPGGGPATSGVTPLP